MKLLCISPDRRIGRWLDTLCDGPVSYRCTNCGGIDEAMRAVRHVEGGFDWVVVDALICAADNSWVRRLRLAGCRAPVVQISFYDQAHNEAQVVPTLICIVEDRGSRQRILGCQLTEKTGHANDTAGHPIYEYRGPQGQKSAASG